MACCSANWVERQDFLTQLKCNMRVLRPCKAHSACSYHAKLTVLPPKHKSVPQGFAPVNAAWRSCRDYVPQSAIKTGVLECIARLLRAFREHALPVQCNCGAFAQDHLPPHPSLSRTTLRLSAPGGAGMTASPACKPAGCLPTTGHVQR